MKKIFTLDDLIDDINETGMLLFWDEQLTSAWTLSGVNFNALWELREQAVNSKRIAYGKFIRKKSTFVSLDLLPHLCALRRDGYDFDSLLDEGRVPNREALIMEAVEKAGAPAPSYALGKTLGIKGYDACVTSLQTKTYLCVTFKKSAMGTALLSKPEDVFGYDFVRSAYSTSNEENARILSAAPGLSVFTDAEKQKLLSPAV